MDNTTACLEGEPCYDFATIIDPPYVMETEEGSGQYQGLVVDLLNKLAHNIGFRYRLKVTSGTFGHLEPDGTWTGLIGNVNTLPADMVVGAMAVTADRQGVLQMTEAFHSSSVQLLLLRPTGGTGPGPGLLLAPFTPSAWVLVALAFVLVSMGLFLIGRFSPRKKSRGPAGKDKQGGRGSFGLKDSFLFTISTLTWQGYRESPRWMSGRLLAVSWWLFVLLILLAYLSNLTAIVSLRPHLHPALPFRTYQDILRDKSLKLGVVRNSDAHTELKSSDDTLQKQLMEYVTARDNLFRSLPEALERMRQSPQERLAMLVPTYRAHYMTSHQCDLISHGHGLGMIRYAFGMPAGNHLEPMKRRINSAILVLQKTGELEELSRKWQHKGSYCPDPEGSSLPVTLDGGGSSLPFMALGPRDLAVAFAVLLVCALLAAGLIVVEVIQGKRKYKRSGQAKSEAAASATTAAAVKQPLVSKEERPEPDVVVTLDGEEDSGHNKNGTNSLDKKLDHTYSNLEEEGKTATDDVKRDTESETTANFHDVTVHQAT